MDINSLYWILLALSSLMLCECGLTPPAFTKFQFVTAPHDVTTTTGQTLQLPCQATYRGQPPEFYSWEKNGDSLAIWSYGTGTGRFLANGTLQIDSVSARGEGAAFGTFQCIAEHINNGESVRIITPPVSVSEASMNDFTVYPAELNIKEGETAMFKCNINSDPVARYEWSRDGVQLTTSSRVIIHHGAQVLEIRQVTVSDSGNYRCKATNIFAERASSSATLLVTNSQGSSDSEGSAPDFIMEPWNTEVVQGNSTTLFCAVNGSDSDGNLSTVSWLFNGQAIETSSSDHYKIVGSGSLKIDNVTKQQQGSYTCRGENLQDVSDSEAQLTVSVPPYFVRKPVDTYAPILLDISLECDIRGSPVPRVTWYKNSDEITPTNYFSIVGRRLTISNLMISDSGYYQCIGVNKAGKVHAVAQVIVLTSDYAMPHSYNVTGSDSVTALPAVSSVPPGPVNLRADIISQKFITLTWNLPMTAGNSPVIFTVNTTRVNDNQQRFRVRSYNTTATDYTAEGLQADTEYLIQVSSFNRIGRSTEHSSLTVKTRPEIQVASAARNLKAWALSDTELRAAWDAPSQTNGAITGYRVYYYYDSQAQEEYQETLTYTALLENLHPHTVYYIRVVASNINGMGEPTNEIDVMTFSAKPSERPQGVTLVTTGVTSLLLRWEEPAVETHNGLLTGYKVKWRPVNSGGERADFNVVDAMTKSLELQNLRANTDYQVRIAAVNINGTGPWTRWISGTTSNQELNELRAPGKPKYLQTRAFARDMIVSWAPADDGVFIRSYKLGYGKTTPDEHWIYELEPTVQIYTLTNLTPQTIYVLQIIALNNAGESQPTRQSDTTVITAIDEERSSGLTAPTEVIVKVLSAYSVLVRWYDSTLSVNQNIADDRYYTVKYNAESYEAQRRTQFVNSTVTRVNIDGLRPYTKYSFSVKVTKNNRDSSFSLTARNTTHEAPPSNSPEDLTITSIAIESLRGHLMVSWQPPSRPNGKILKYTIYSSTDNRTPLINWIVDVVDGETLNHEFGPVTRNTLYFFKIAANNSRGASPLSDMQVFQTADEFGFGENVITSGNGDSGPHSGGDPEDLTSVSKQPSAQTLTIIIACVSVVTAIAIAALLAIYCKKCILNNKNRPNLKASNQAPKGVRPTKEQDLWINNDGQMEMRNLTPAQRQHLEIDEKTSMLHSHSHMDIGNCSAAGDNVFDEPDLPRYSTLGRQRTVFITPRYRDAPGIVYQQSACPYSTMPRAAVQPMSAERPLFPRTQFTSNNYGSTPRVHVVDSHPGSETSSFSAEPDFPKNDSVLQSTVVSSSFHPQPQYNNLDIEPYPHQGGPYVSGPHVSGPHMSGPHMSGHHVSAFHAPMMEDTPPPRPPPMEGRGAPLRSFSIPAPPSHNIPKHIVKPQPIVQVPSEHSDPPSNTSSLKRPPRPPYTSIKPPHTPTHDDNLKLNMKNGSTEQLSSEMAHLDNIMQDLNAMKHDFEYA